MNYSVRRTARLAPFVMCVILAGCDMLVSTDARIVRAEESLESGKLDAALADARAVVEKDAQHVGALTLLARISLKYGDAQSALADLDRAQAAGASPAALQPVRDEALLLAGRFEDLVKSAAPDAAPVSASHHIAVATAHAALGNLEEAGRVLVLALALEPDNAEAKLLQVRLLQAGGDTARATAALDELLTAKPDLARGWMLRGQLALAANDAVLAQTAFEKAQPLAARQIPVTDQLGLIAALIETRLANADLPGSAQALEQLKKRAPDAPITQLLASRVAMAQGDTDSAVATLQRLLAMQPDNVQARLLLGAALMQQGSTEQARSQLTALIADRPDDLGARQLLARLYLSENNTREASRVMAEAPAGAAPNSSADWLRSSILTLSGETTEAVELLERTAKADPTNVPLQLDLARSYLSVGKTAEATAIVKAIPAQKAGKTGRQLQVLAGIQGKTPGQMRQALVALGDESPRDAELLALIGAAQLELGDVAVAEKTLRKAVELQPGNSDALLALAGLSFSQKDVPGARSRLEQIIKSEPRQERAYLALAALAVQEGNSAEAARVLEKAISADATFVESRLQLAQLAFLGKDPARAKSLLSQAVSVARDKGAALVRVGDLQMRTANPADALASYRTAVERGSRDAILKVATAQLALNQTDEARRSLTEAVSRQPSWAQPVAMLTSLDLPARRYDAALGRIDQFRRAGGSEAMADELRASVFAAQGKTQEALTASDKAYRLEPSPSRAFAVFSARKSAGTAEPHRVLRQWLTVQPADQRIRAALAQHLMESGDNKGAIAEYETVVATSSDPVVLNNLAWLYQTVKDDRAEAMAKRAHEAAPASPAIADTYGWILLENGRAAEALPLLKGAAEALPQNADVQANYARARAATEK